MKILIFLYAVFIYFILLLVILVATLLDHCKEEKKNYAYNWVVEDHCHYVSN